MTSLFIASKLALLICWYHHSISLRNIQSKNMNQFLQFLGTHSALMQIVKIIWNKNNYLRCKLIVSSVSNYFSGSRENEN